MAALNRNIIEGSDIDSLEKGLVPATFDTMPPANASISTAGPVPAPAGPAPAPAPAPAPGGTDTPVSVPKPTADNYITKLLKYVPLEVLGFYLFVQGLIIDNVDDRHERAIWLGSLLVLILVLTAAYDKSVLSIKRVTQIVMSVVGLAIYIFAIGGWFATTTWYQAWYATIALAVFGLAVSFIKLPPLSTNND
jgi:hypothetical protein